MSFLAMLKAARASAKEEKEDPSSPLPFRNTEAPPCERREVAKEAIWRPSYAHPWPDDLPGLGPRRIGPFDHCIGCGIGTWVRYGAAVLCCPCAIRERVAPLSGNRVEGQ